MPRLFALSSFSEWQEYVGREISYLSQVTVFAFTCEQLFPSCRFVAGIRVKKCSARYAKKRALTARV